VHRELALVIVSERGLCGAYNGNVLRKALAHVRDLQSRKVEFDLEVSGKKAVGFFRFARVKVATRHTQFGDKPKYEDVQRLAERYMADFTQGKYDAVRVVSMRFITNARQVPEVMQLLPLSARAEAGASETQGAAALYAFSPSSEELLAELLPVSVKTALFQAFNEAVVSEQVMRMVAMKAATDNAGSLGRTLRRQYNRARQTQITTELMEIIGGAAALE
jgi:F-type H+-transporting ATPase subunit gamma